MSGQIDVKQTSCPKCRNKNPAGAAFCGFCGAAIREQPAPERATMFGYAADFGIDHGKQGPGATAVAQASPATAAKSAGRSTVVDEDAPTSAYSAGQAFVAKRYWLRSEAKRIAVGEVYGAQDVQEKKVVDLVMVDATVFPSPLDMERARRELRQLQKLDDARLISVLDHGKSDDGRLYIAVEHVEGRPLDQLAKAQPLPFESVVRITRDVGAALAAAQSVGVIHRDIEPGNVIVSNDGAARLRMLGVAPQIKPLIQGTAEFISPEQAAGRPVDQRSNIYSLGALMFFAFTGVPPFQGSVDELLDRHQNAEPPSLDSLRPGDVPARMQALITKAMAKNSSRRHLTLRQFLREVEGLQGQAAPQSSAATRPSKAPSMTLAADEAILPTLLPNPQVHEAVKPEAPDPAARPLRSATSEVAVKQAPAAAPAPNSSAPDQQKPTRPPVTAASGGTVTGEMSGGARVALKQSEQVPVRGSVSSATKPAQQPSGGKSFRETMWFFKGEVESAMAEKGEPPHALSETEEASPTELADKYTDDGSLSNEEARRLSLRTGRTQMMNAVKVPSGQLPGARMDAEDFIDEMNRGGRTMAMFIGIGLVVLVVGGVLWAIFG